MTQYGKHTAPSPRRQGGHTKYSGSAPVEEGYDPLPEADGERAAVRPSARPVPRPGRKQSMPLWRMILLDVLAIGVGLNLFALFHHVLHLEATSEPVALPSAAPVYTPAPTPVQSAEEEPETSPLPLRSGQFGEKFRDKFTDGEVITTEDSYRSGNINVTYSHVEQDGIIYNVADVYVSDLRFLRAGMGKDAYNKGSEDLLVMAQRHEAVAAISGDHYYARLEGVVARNGVLYRETRFQDVCILMNDGQMVTLTDAQLDMDSLKATGAWQVWGFGPKLLDNGVVCESFNSDVTRANPRSAIGYVEPGHYVLVQVDGRIKSSRGMSMTELAQLFADYGCTAAFNLDGGQSAGFVWQGELVSYPYGRPVSDMIYVTDFAEEDG